MRLLRNRTDIFDNYEWTHFRSLIEDRFNIAEMIETHDGSRKLCLLLPRGKH